MLVESIASPFLTLSYLLDAGPRLVRLCLAGSQENLLGETPDQSWETPNGLYRTIGGHRLWHAPQVGGRTDVPDDRLVTREQVEDGVRLVQAVEEETGIQKTIQVRLFSDRPGLEIIHTLANCGRWTVELAPWAITQLPMGGEIEVPLPFVAPGMHTSIPNRPLIFWPYTHMDDSRLVFEAGSLHLRGEPGLPMFKMGCFCAAGWASYTRAGVILRKRFTPYPGQAHTDLGCNLELFVSDETLELETLGPLVHLEPGAVVRHCEVWEIDRVSNG